MPAHANPELPTPIAHDKHLILRQPNALFPTCLFQQKAAVRWVQPVNDLQPSFHGTSQLAVKLYNSHNKATVPFYFITDFVFLG